MASYDLPPKIIYMLYVSDVSQKYSAMEETYQPNLSGSTDTLHIISVTQQEMYS